ncbi:transmembrane protein 192 isoform X2 [Stomoxys calcitrans]|uniref:Transmembrane protein 192 n=1 Tax=Stomoxys calcitrans TaxID=35570 RepID=A0A1I8Q7V0_STOCA|nr:transmembrane protein 192 isoform X2 [Stomoxys calcitrans]
MDSQNMDDISVTDIEPILTSSGNEFKKLKTIPASCIHLLIAIIFLLVAIVLVFIWPEEKNAQACFILTTCRGVLWIITLLFNSFLQRHHNNLRMNGFHDFHRTMVKHNGKAFCVVSGFNTILLVNLSIIFHNYGNLVWNSWFTPVTSIVAVLLLELFILITTHGLYIVQVYNFNKSASSPDALLGSNMPAGSLGLMQPDGNVAELLEKQADLIAYLKDHNQKLNQKLHSMQLTTRASSYNR